MSVLIRRHPFIICTRFKRVNTLNKWGFMRLMLLSLIITFSCLATEIQIPLGGYGLPSVCANGRTIGVIAESDPGNPAGGITAFFHTTDWVMHPLLYINGDQIRATELYCSNDGIIIARSGTGRWYIKTDTCESTYCLSLYNLNKISSSITSADFKYYAKGSQYVYNGVACLISNSNMMIGYTNSASNPRALNTIPYVWPGDVISCNFQDQNQGYNWIVYRKGENKFYKFGTTGISEVCWPLHEWIDKDGVKKIFFGRLDGENIPIVFCKSTGRVYQLGDFGGNPAESAIEGYWYNTKWNVVDIDINDLNQAMVIRHNGLYYDDGN